MGGSAVISVHPHASGEHVEFLVQSSDLRGSSPREWGTHLTLVNRRVEFRFIPTRVGNTVIALCAKLPYSVHPHASGEHNPETGLHEYGFGSSPREWGTQDVFLIVEHRARFIPTRVGNTPSASPPAARPAVHPHASGEHTSAVRSRLLANGSSPREWGTPVQRGRASPRSRFIPTRVGNTTARRAPVKIYSVHPHASGEH